MIEKLLTTILVRFYLLFFRVASRWLSSDWWQHCSTARPLQHIAAMGGMSAGVDEYYHQRTLSVFERMKNQAPEMRLRLLSYCFTATANT